MRTIYHMTTPRAWHQSGPDAYRAASLDTEGFIHCSNAEQVAAAANRFYADEPELLVLCLDTAKLESALRDETAGTGELFPHIYGPINRDAIQELRRLERGADGQWAF